MARRRPATPNRGLYFKLPFIQEVRRFPKTLQLWTSDEDITDLPAADGKKVEVRAWAIWKITDPRQFVKVLRTVDQGQAAVKDRVRAAIRDEITSNNLAEVGAQLVAPVDLFVPI